jgi:hypothetical protein
MNEFIEYLGQEIAMQEVLQQQLRNTLREKKLEFEARPSLWPMRGYITSGFGPRRSPFGRRPDFHNGVDIKAPYGTPVHAPGAGRVTEVVYQRGYGLVMVVVHDFAQQPLRAPQVAWSPRPEVGAASSRFSGIPAAARDPSHYEVRSTASRSTRSVLATDLRPALRLPGDAICVPASVNGPTRKKTGHHPQSYGRPPIWNRPHLLFPFFRGPDPSRGRNARKYPYEINVS